MNPIFLIIGGIILLALIASVKFFRVLFLIGIIGAIIYFVAVPGSFSQLTDRISNSNQIMETNHRTNYTSTGNTNYTTTDQSSSSESNYDSDRTIDDARRQINNIGDAYLGEGKTEKITNIATDENRTPEQAAKDIVKEIPTGLPGPVDHYVKQAALKIFDASTK